MSAEVLYAQLRQLVASMPALAGPGPITAEDHGWLGRASALVEAAGEGRDATMLKMRIDSLGTILRSQSAHSIAAIVHRALSRAEMAAPAAARGAFIAAGEPFSALAAVAQVFGQAKTGLLLVDKYAEASILTDFAVTAPVGVEVHILTMLKEAKRATLTPVIERWALQFGTTRPVSVRMVPGSALHDRLILVDWTDAWITGQSFNHLAETAPTYLSRLDPELAEAKVAAYREMWEGAEPL